MKINDLISEAPMGLGKTLTTKLKSFVPGSTGARAKGELDVGKVANQWKKDYANFLGKLGYDGFGDTKSFISFLKTLGFTHKQMNKVFKGGGYATESVQIYEAALTSRMIDTLMTRAARIGAMAAMGVDRPLPKEPNPTAPRKPGAIDAAVDIGKKAAGQIGKKYSQARAHKAGINAVRNALSQKVEPTINIPQPAATPSATTQDSPKFEPSRQAPKMKTKQKPTYGAPLQVPTTSEPTLPKFEPARKAPKMKTKPVTKYK